MKKIFRGLALLLAGVAATAMLSGRSELQTPESLFSQMQGFLAKKDFQGYLGLFDPAIREGEEERLAFYRDDFKMDGVKVRLAGKRVSSDGQTSLFLQVYFQNAYAAAIESWQLGLAEVGGHLEIASKDLLSGVSSLYRIRIPSSRAERVRSIEITHEDIRLTFKDAAVFYDNVPDIDTALIVVGKGTVSFTPSDANESHQLELLYKKRTLEDDLDYAYLRAGNGFFSSHVKIERGTGLEPVSRLEQDRAASIFSKAYPRSFTIQNSLDGELLSFLPQGDESVFEFRGRRAGELTYIYYPFSDEEVSLYDRSQQRIISLYSPGKDEGGAGGKKLFVSFGERFHVESYRLDLSYSPDPSFLSAKARIHVVPKAAAVGSLKFRFNPELEILKICDGENRELFYTVDKLRQFIYIYLIVPAAPDKGEWIEVYYRGKLRPSPPTTDVVGQSSVANKYVFRPRYDTHLFTQASYWYPSPPEEDYFQARLKIVVPPEFKCVANGDMIGRTSFDEMDDVVEIEKAGSNVYTFETRYPIKYMSFLVGKLERRQEWKEPVPIQTYVSTDVMGDVPETLDEARDILDFYAGVFGPFPYEKLGIVLRSWPTAGGHSPASFIVMNQVPWDIGPGARVGMDAPVSLTKWGDYFLAHEIAHQWWGQGVSFTTYKDQWMSEGLAQFAAALYLGKKGGPRAAPEILKKLSQWTAKKSTKGPVEMGSRLSFFDFDAYQAVVYDKAALTLFMLRDFLGEDVFFSGLREFFQSHKFSAARTGDFIASMEKAAGRSLGDFFRGWFDSYELPDVQTIWSQEPVPGGTRLKIRTTQVKGRFVFPLWVEWSGGGKTGRSLVRVESSVQETFLDVPASVERVRINPDGLVPGKFY